MFPPASDKPPSDKPPAPPFGGPPAKDKPAGDNPADKIKATLDEADAGGKLEPIKAILQKLGRDDIDAKEVAKLAQKDDRTHGKPIEEIASMIEADEGLLDDILEYKDDGMFGKRGMGMKPDDEKAEGEMPPGDGKTSDEMM